MFFPANFYSLIINKISLFFFIPLLLMFVSCVDGRKNYEYSEVVSEQEFIEKYSTTEKIAQYLRNKTVYSYDPKHVTQIEYHSDDNRSFLWYPGNNIILPGEWKVIDRRIYKTKIKVKTSSGIEKRTINTPFLCYRYGENTYNPVTKKKGSVWQCSNFFIWNINIPGMLEIEKRDGDLFFVR